MPMGSRQWHRRFEARVVASVIILVALSTGAILYATTRVVTARSLERTRLDLQAARTAFQRLADDRARFAAAQSALVTALPVFRAHLTDTRLAEDVATVEAMADGYRRQLDAHFAIVTDREGRWTATPGWPAGARAGSEVDAAIAEATAGRPGRTMAAVADRLFLVVSEPAMFADELLGTLTIGYALDDEVAGRLAEVTHCQVNLIAGGRLFASSLPPTDRAALVTAMTQATWPASSQSGTVQRIGDGRYVVGTFPLSGDTAGAAAGTLILLEDWAPTEAFVSEIRGRLLATGAVIFAFALAIGIFFSRRIGRPIEDLAAAAKDISTGNWTRQLPVRGTAEEVVMAQAVNAMTTSLRHWYEAAKARDEQLRQAQKLDALGRLAGGIAHDFNNFLTAISGYGWLLLEELDGDDRRRGKVDGILKAADTAASLTRQLLTFSRQRVVAVRVVNVGELLGGTEKLLRRLIGEDVTLTTTMHTADGYVRADPHQLEQVLVNLVVNARDAMATGGRIEIDLADAVSPGTADACLRLSVRDNGCGMTPEVKARIFEPFFTTKAEGAGTGLGLAMVYSIVEQLGGTIVVDTEVGRGTTFHIDLPLTMEREAEPDAAITARIADGTETVLLVEDEPQVASLLTHALEASGYTVLQAADGAAALQLVRGHDQPIHLLLTDVVMPGGMNGRELADRIKEERADIAVLFMSGYADDAILRNGVHTATAQFLAKPFSMATLRRTVRDVLTVPCEPATLASSSASM
jgi:signal transduction histidine kinase/ActR/RegA family two-component response regulator